MTRYRIALIPGDGIGAEVLPPARALLDAAFAALAAGVRTADLGGTASTDESTRAALAQVGGARSGG